MSNTKPNSSQITYDSGPNKQDLNNILDTIVPIEDYAELRNYSGRATTVRITTPGIAGFFKLSGTTSASNQDNGGTIIVKDANASGTTITSASGKPKWERVFDGAVNVKWFGAKGDNDTDCSLAFELSNAAANGGTIFIPDGQFQLSRGVTLTSSLIGNGRATLIILTSSTSQIKLNAEARRFECFSILPNISTEVPAIEIIGGKSFWAIEDIFVRSNGSIKVHDGIKVSDGLSGTISNCRVDGSINIGIHVTAAIAGNANAISLQTCRVRNCGVANFRYENGFNGSVTACVSEGLSPILFDAISSQVNFIGCYTETDFIGGVRSGIAYKLDACIGCFISCTSSTVSRTFVLINGSADNMVIGSGYDTNDKIIEVDNTCRDNTFFYGGYIPNEKIFNSGERTTLYVNGGFASGTASAPGLRFNSKTVGDKVVGLYATSGLIGLSHGGVSFFEAVSSGINTIRSGQAVVRVQDTDSTSRYAGFEATTYNGTWKFGPNIGGGSTFKITSHLSKDVLDLINPVNDGETSFKLRVRTNSTTEGLLPVTVGAADSGGLGFRILRVPN